MVTGLLTLCVAASVAVGQSYDPNAKALLDTMVARWNAVSSATYRIHKTERMRDGEVVVEEVAFKFKRPGQMYLAAILPRVGQELIYNAKRSRDEFTVHPGRFPDVTLNLSLTSSLALERQHHQVLHSELGYTFAMLSRDLARAEREGAAGAVRYQGANTVRGRAVEIITVELSALPPLRVQAQAGESLFAFAERVGMDAYVIFNSNPSLDAFGDELEAASYLVPRFYGAKTEFVIDVELQLPVSVTIWDDRGRVYERYSYTEMVINPPLTPLDFDPDNPAYHF